MCKGEVGFVLCGDVYLFVYFFRVAFGCRVCGSSEVGF